MAINTDYLLNMQPGDRVKFELIVVDKHEDLSRLVSLDYLDQTTGRKVTGVFKVVKVENPEQPQTSVPKVVYCSGCSGKYKAYIGCSRSWREEWHCEGCRKPMENCTC